MGRSATKLRSTEWTIREQGVRKRSINVTKNMYLRRAWGTLMGEATSKRSRGHMQGIQSSAKYGGEKERRVVHSQTGYAARCFTVTQIKGEMRAKME